MTNSSIIVIDNFFFCHHNALDCVDHGSDEKGHIIYCAMIHITSPIK